MNDIIKAKINETKEYIEALQAELAEALFELEKLQIEKAKEKKKTL